MNNVNLSTFITVHTDEKKQNSVPDILTYFHVQPPYMLRRLRRLSNYFYTQECSKLKLSITLPQLEALIIITASPHIDQVTLAKGLGADRSTTMALVDILERNGWVKRNNAVDRRRNALVTTKTAAKILESAITTMQVSNNKLLSPLTTKQQKRLISILFDLALHKNSPAPILALVQSEKNEIQNQLNLVYQMPSFLMDRCSQIESTYMNEVAKQFELTYGQTGTLLAVGLLSPITQGELSHAAGLNRSSLSVILPVLIKNGLIEKGKDPQDKRKTLLTSLPKGIRLIETMYPFANKATQQCFNDISPEIKQEFCALLSTLVAAHESINTN